MTVTGKGENTLGLNLPEGDGKHLRVNQCYLCRAWQLDKNLSPIDIPDQAGWVEKKGCKKCLDEILKAEAKEHEGSKTV